jgi:succinate dehydrogenase flavin-adding protein (antitoxin of CptAB toxin-antitoxin module)
MAYLEVAFVSAPAEEQAAFERLLSLQDPDIHALLTGRLYSEDAQLRHVLKRLLQHA